MNAQNTASAVNLGDTQRWRTLWGLPVSSQPLVIRKTTKGESTEAAGSHPFQALIWLPLEATGREWARCWFNSNAAGGAGTCGARLLRATRSELYPRTNTAPNNVGTGQNANAITWGQDVASSQTIESIGGSGRTETSGTWANYTTGSQTPVTRYSTTAGASVQYSVTGATRILWRFITNSSNGGKIAVTVTESGTEISAANYRVGPNTGTRIVNQAYTSSAISNPSTYVGHQTIASGLDPAKTYVVTLTLNSGSRIYDSGVLGYNNLGGVQYNAAGYTGIWDRYNFATTGNNYAASLYAGSRCVFTTPTCTRIDLAYAKRVNGGFCGVTIYDSVGNEIDSSNYRNLTTHANGWRYFDCYNASSVEASITLAAGLTPGVYYVHLWSLPDASNSYTETTAGSYLSSRWAVYVGTLSTYNTSTGGTVGVDSFIDNVTQYAGGGSDPLDAAGNFVFAGQVRDSGDPVFASLPEVGYVTATHGAETDAASLTVTIDGSTVNWAAAADQTQWTGSEIVVSFTTQIGTQANPTSYWANATYTLKFNRFGIWTTFSMTTTRDIRRGVWYCNQNIAPNTTATNGTLLGSGFSKLYIEPATSASPVSSAGGASHPIARPHRGTCFYTPEGYALAVRTLNAGDVWAAWNGTETATLWFERLRTTKTYAVVYNDTTGGTGTVVPSGSTFTFQQVMRFFADSRIPTFLT